MVVGRQKLVAKDARVSVPEKKTDCYVLRETPSPAEDEILEQFNSTRSARRRIALAVEMMDATGRKDVKLDLSVVLKGVADAVKDSNQLDSSERLFGAAVRDDLAKAVGAENNYEPTQAAIIANHRDLPVMAEKIPVQFQSRFLDLIQETHPIEPGIFFLTC